MNTTEKIMSLLSSSYSTFHVVKNIKDELLNAGFISLDEKENYRLKLGKNYFVTRNDTSIIAFKLPKKLKDFHMQISATHNDSPTFKIKPDPLMKAGNLLKLNTEPYGGGIYNTWFDKPLSIAGRVYVKNGNQIISKLINIDKDLLIIPNVCIHMNRDINNNYHCNPAIDTIPLIGEEEEGFDFNQYLLEEGKLEGTILSYDLTLYNRQKPALLGIKQEFLASPREDDLTAAYSALLGFLDSDGDSISMFASFDNEEVGSLTKQGANSTFLEDNLKRIITCLDGTKDDFQKAMAQSMMISIDNAHANHPNHPEYSDKTANVEMNKGIVIKYNANQTYTSDSLSSSVVKAICKDHDIPYQEYTNRSDLRGGSTLGNLSQSQVSITTVDIGIAQLAMHSSYETLGAKDLQYMVDFVKAFFSSSIRFSKSDISID